ncbi:MAG: hypothetical protein EOP86_10950 [Verrucomicrobiaceae bacterium]|nr:MAG: hypothetical protein EOP86_10950 [Verrucomicrobiaceae bacterium]
MNPRTASALLLFCAPAMSSAGTSAHYNLPSQATGTAGGRGVSASYTSDAAECPGGAGGSAAYTSRTGFAGRLDEIIGIGALLNPSPLAETASGQLTAGLLSTAGFLTALPAADTAWTILDGPLTDITPGGVVTAGKVPQTTTATVRAAAHGMTGTLSFPVQDTLYDNFGIYAGDGLPDWWQIRFSGIAATAGGQTGDPDHDGRSNLLEFAFGTDPGTFGTGSIAYADGILTSRGQPLPLIRNIPNSVDFRIVFARWRDFESLGLHYEAQFSANLVTWVAGPGTPVIEAEDAEFEAVSVPWPLFINGRKARFFRMVVSYTP